MQNNSGKSWKKSHKKFRRNQSLPTTLEMDQQTNLSPASILKDIRKNHA